MNIKRSISPIAQGVALRFMVSVVALAIVALVGAAAPTKKKTQRVAPSLAFPTPGELPTDPPLTRSYDRFDDMTTLSVRGVEIGEHLTVSPQILFRGTKRPRATDATFDFMFSSRSDDWRFLKYHDFVVIADDKRIELDSRHDGEVVGEGVIETVFVPIPAATFLRLANSTKIEARLGSTEIRLAPDTIEALRQLASCMHPDGFARCAALADGAK